MRLEELSAIMRENGIVGAGGAGFPSYAKLNMKADTIILNCAECEPLLRLHRQLLADKSFEIMTALTEVAEAVEADQIIIAVKDHYKAAIESVKANMSSFPKVKIGLLEDIYPSGDEIVTIYETTKRVVPPGKLPIEVGVIVYNVETMYNLYMAITNKKPVTHKYITVAGEVKNPGTFLVPLGMTFDEVVALTGGPVIENYAYISGGPMTGRIGAGTELVTKTSNAILVLPENNFVVKKKKTPVSLSMKQAASVCCQCRMCTDLCPRNLLGYPIEPHAFMRGATTGQIGDVRPYLNTQFCSQCGVCEMYACGQGLNPRTLLGEFKKKMAQNGLRPAPEDIVFSEVNPGRDYRCVPMPRLRARLGLATYDKPAPMSPQEITVKKVKIAMSQHIGAPAAPAVKVGDKVTEGQVIGMADTSKLGVNIHSSVNGTVIDVNDRFVTIEA